jgi:HlyD family secretion protein
MVQNATLEKGSSSLVRNRWIIIATIALCIGGTTMGLFWRNSISSTQPQLVPVSDSVVRTVTALGRLEPKGEVIQLSAPASSQASRVEQLLVKEGDRVKAGQTVAILDSRARASAAVDEAEAQVRVAQAKLAQIQAGAKRGEIAAQQALIARLDAQHQGDVDAQAATVARLQAQAQNAAVENQRYGSLYQEGAISASERDSKRLTLETDQKSLQEAQAVLRRIQTTSSPQLSEAKANLARIAEVRPTDLQAAEAEINRAKAAVNQAKADLEQAFVKSPQNGSVLSINTHPGELIGDSGIVEIGQTDPMYAVAEVYQSDIRRVRAGQRVRLTSDSLSDELQGTVEWIGAQVQRQDIVNTDPSENIDARVVEVHVRPRSHSSQTSCQVYQFTSQGGD